MRARFDIQKSMSAVTVVEQKRPPYTSTRNATTSAYRTVLSAEAQSLIESIDLERPSVVFSRNNAALWLPQIESGLVRLRL